MIPDSILEQLDATSSRGVGSEDRNPCLHGMLISFFNAFDEDGDEVADNVEKIARILSMALYGALFLISLYQVHRLLSPSPFSTLLITFRRVKESIIEFVLSALCCLISLLPGCISAYTSSPCCCFSNRPISRKSSSFADTGSTPFIISALSTLNMRIFIAMALYAAMKLSLLLLLDVDVIPSSICVSPSYFFNQHQCKIFVSSTKLHQQQQQGNDQYNFVSKLNVRSHVIPASCEYQNFESDDILTRDLIYEKYNCFLFQFQHQNLEDDKENIICPSRISLHNILSPIFDEGIIIVDANTDPVVAAAADNDIIEDQMKSEHAKFEKSFSSFNHHRPKSSKDIYPVQVAMYRDWFLPIVVTTQLLYYLVFFTQIMRWNEILHPVQQMELALSATLKPIQSKNIILRIFSQALKKRYIIETGIQLIFVIWEFVIAIVICLGIASTVFDYRVLWNMSFVLFFVTDLIVCISVLACGLEIGELITHLPIHSQIIGSRTRLITFHTTVVSICFFVKGAKSIFLFGLYVKYGKDFYDKRVYLADLIISSIFLELLPCILLYAFNVRLPPPKRSQSWEGAPDFNILRKPSSGNAASSPSRLNLTQRVETSPSMNRSLLSQAEGDRMDSLQSSFD